MLLVGTVPWHSPNERMNECMCERRRTFEQLQRSAASGAHVTHLILRLPFGTARRRVSTASKITDEKLLF